MANRLNQPQWSSSWNYTEEADGSGAGERTGVQQDFEDFREDMRVTHAPVVPVSGATDIIWGRHLPGTSITEPDVQHSTIALVQRRAAMLFVGGMCTSPTDMLYTHANLLLFHLLVVKVSCQSLV